MQALNELLVCNGSAAPRDEPQHLERLPSSGVTWLDRTVEAAVRRCHVGSVAWPVYASPVGPRLWLLWEKLHMCRPLYLECEAAVWIATSAVCSPARALHTDVSDMW